MKTQLTHKILIPVVVIIWSVFLGEYVINWQAPDEKKAAKSKSVILALMESDSFHLSGEYRDPFLSVFQESQTTSHPEISAINAKLSIKKKRAHKSFDLPDMHYQGWVQSMSSMAPVGLITIHGQPRQVKVGDSLAGVKVISVGADQLQIMVGDSLISINR
jgi:hypothetical protein